MVTYYPLAVGNSWTYMMKDGITYTNTVTGADGSVFTTHNSFQDKSSVVRKDGDNYLTDAYEPGNFQITLKEGLQKGDTWDINYTANTISCIQTMTVKGTGISMEVNGKNYPDLLLVEGDMKMNMNGTVLSMNCQTQNYYAPGIGLVLTTSSYGDWFGLVSYELK